MHEVEGLTFKIHEKKNIAKKVINQIQVKNVAKGKDIDASCNTKKGRRKRKRYESRKEKIVKEKTISEKTSNDGDIKYWKKKSTLWELPYWKSLYVHHCLM